MLGRYKYTDKEIKVLLDSMVTIIDTREQENSHITNYLTKQKRPFKSQKLDFGDYSLCLPKNEELQIMRDIYFTDNIVLERKAKIIEVVNNLCEDGGTRLENEFIRGKGSKFYFMIEKATYSDALRGEYEISPGKISKYKAETFIDRLKTFEARYDIIIHWEPNILASGNYIYYTFRRWLREQLKQGSEILCQ
jgi:hypothetical protein